MRGEGFLREVVEPRMEGKKPRGRRRMEMLKELYEQKSYLKIKRKAEV